jgi:EAL domain-containing protein (putative c-di-GMP-specific phosphodiesterase class I)
VQWHRQSGVVSQPDVLRLALESGRLAPITNWLLHTACTDARAWQSSRSPLIRVSVPISRQQFALNHLVDGVDRALRESGLDPACVNLELDEGIFLFDVEDLAVKLRALREVGLTLSIADFGAGYAPLTDLAQYPIDGLTIGRDLVSHLTIDPDCAATVRGIIAMAHELAMSVVADGVQNESQAAWLQAQRCEMIRGDLVAGLLSAEAVRHMRDGAGGAECPAA